MHRGDLAAARHALAEADQARSRGGAATFSELAALAAARLHEAEERPDAALSVLVEARDTATARGSAADLPALAVDLVRLSLAHGEEGRARQALAAMTRGAGLRPGRRAGRRAQLAKLGCRSRAEIAVAIVRHDGRPTSPAERADR
jgi:hypothetical protein